MIGKIVTGKSFRGLARYLVKDPSRVAWTSTRNTFEQDPYAVASEMKDEALTSQRTRKPVYHIAIALDPEDVVTRADLERIADRTLSDMGLAHHQALIVAHTDKAHTHIHIMVNRVHGGRAWDTFRDRYRLRLTLEAQEREMDLRRTGRNAERAPDRESRSRHFDPKDGRLFAQHVRHEAGDDFRQASSWKDLKERLRKYGLRLEARGAGLVVTDGRRYAKLSSVSRQWSRPKLEARFGPFEQEKHMADRALRQKDIQKWRNPKLPLPGPLDPRLRDLSGQRKQAVDEAASKDLIRKARAASRLARQAFKPTGDKNLDALLQTGVRYEAAFRLESELHAKNEELGALRAKAHRYDQVEKDMQAAKGEYERHLKAAYVDPTSAHERFLVVARKHGATYAEMRMHADPEHFGRLKKGAGIGRILSKGENEAALAAGDAATAGRRYHQLKAQLPGERRDIAKEISGLEREVSRLKGQLSEYPPTSQLRREALRQMRSQKAKLKGLTGPVGLIAKRLLRLGERAVSMER